MSLPSWRGLRARGFDGPRYTGLRGRLRFVVESTLWRRELVFVCTPASFAAARGDDAPDLVLHDVADADGWEPFRAGLEAAWYPGIVERLREPFGWGEQAVVGTVDGRVASYNWMQRGTREGVPTYYGRMMEDDARILRGSVAPAFRRRGLNTSMKRALLRRLFASGATRVLAECYLNNVPSVRTLLRLGFRAVGVLTVVEAPPLRGFVRWERADVAAELARLGIGRDASDAVLAPDALLAPAG